MNQTESVDVLCKKIIEDAQGQADAVITRARAKAAEELSLVRQEAEKMQQRLLREASQRAEGEQRKILSMVKLEIKRLYLSARQKVREKVFQQAVRGQEELRKSGNYPERLKKLAAEAIYVLELSEVEVYLGEEEYRLLGEKFAQSLSDYTRDAFQKNVGVMVFPDSAIREAGVIVKSKDKHIIFDNTFSARFRRKKESVTMALEKELEIIAKANNLFS